MNRQFPRLAFVRYLWGGLAAALGLLAAIAVVIALRAKPDVIPLSPTTNLRVLKVSLGTNHVFSREASWRQALRSLLPDSLEGLRGSFVEWQSSTRHSSLVVWLVECDAAGKWQANRFDSPAALLENGVMAAGRSIELPTRIIRAEFSSFARDLEQVPLQVRYGTNTVRFTVRNPHRTVRTVLHGATLPQTNMVKGTQVVITSLRTRNHGSGLEYEALVRTLADPPARWCSWRVTAFDDLGNWNTSEFQHSSVVRIPPLPGTHFVLKLSIEGLEYISAGFQEPLAAEASVILRPHPRARTYGVQTVMAVGPGAYVVSNGLAVAIPNRLVPGKELEFELGNTNLRTNRTFRFITAVPAILCVSEGLVHEPAPSVRMRERLPGNRGRIFTTRRSASVMNESDGRNHIATLSAIPIPYDATNIEIEIIGTLPPVNFSVSLPEHSPPLRQTTTTE